MKLPGRYNDALRSLPITEVNYGCGGIRLFGVGEVEEGQVGYSAARDGFSLCSGEPGAWQSNWIVIGYEAACGDPLFIDIDSAASPVFTAMHGQGAWKPALVASSLEAFAMCIIEFSRISAGRNNPVERDANPISDNERTVFLRRIAKLNQSEIAPEFWAVLLEC